MRKGKKNHLIVALFVILLALAIGYAAFADQLQISGTAKATGNWDIHFENATMDPVADANNTIIISDEDTVSVNVKLEEPGDTKTARVHIVNEGSVDAILTSFNVEAIDKNSQTITSNGGVYTYGAIKMTLEPASSIQGTTLEAGTGDLEYVMTFEWPSDYVIEDIDDTATFTISFNYDQKTN